MADKADCKPKSGLRDNRARGSAADFLGFTAGVGSSLSIVSAYFTSFAYERMAPTLDHIDGLRFLFGEPRFLGAADAENLEPATFLLDEVGLSLKDGLKKRAVALRCAEWMRSKVQVRSVKRAGLLHGKLFHVHDGKREHAMVGSSNFTLNGLGIADQPNIELNLVVDSDRDREDLLAWFDELWTDTELTQDVREEVLRQLERACRHNSPDFIYFKTLFHLFETDVAEQILDDDRLRDARFTDTAIWNMLYAFQRDGLRAVLSKLDHHGGCILADSVGLGKTFVALAAIKWFELRNQRVLVLCPRKLRDNWTEFLAQNNSETNPLSADRFAYTVLSHTDLTRTSGRVGDTNLATVNWGNYDLVVLDESHNFRTASRGRPASEAGPARLSRYEKLMDHVVRSGLKTKVLMLSATPVNNDLSDLKSQLDLIVGGASDGFASLGIGNLSALIGEARRKFRDWLRGGSRDRNTLIAQLPPALFSLLDSVTIARSRGHVERHYATASEEVGRFPRREKPLSIFPVIDSAGQFPTFEHVHDEIDKLQLALYNPIRFVREEHRHFYDPGGNFDQVNRERFLIGMMKTGFLKRLESSVSSFCQTMDRLCARIGTRLAELEEFDARSLITAEESPLGEDDDELTEAFEVGGALKFSLSHMEVAEWKDALHADRERLAALSKAAANVTPERDAKLQMLRQLLADMAAKPSTNMAGEPIQKAIIFTAYADTAAYLYEHLAPSARELGMHAAIVTGGSGCKATYGKARYQDILVNFAPRAKKRAAMKHMDQRGEIDLLIATDCISEGQNLQDSNLVINYDIHWNPVRLIQRFGRIDRIGSVHESIQMVNFWPTPDLNRYIKLKDRVEARMALVDLSATGDDNLLDDVREAAKADLQWRDKQLLRLKDEVFDLEDAREGITLSEFTLEDFRADLFQFTRSSEDELHSAPMGLYALTPAAIEGGKLDPGVIFCLRRNGQAAREDEAASVNGLEPFFLVYVRDDGSILHGFGSPKSILDSMRALCLGRTEPFESLCNAFDDETERGRDVNRYTELALAAVDSIAASYAAKALGALAMGKGGKVADEKQQPRGEGDFELITWLLVRDEDDG